MFHALKKRLFHRRLDQAQARLGKAIVEGGPAAIEAALRAGANASGLVTASAGPNVHVLSRDANPSHLQVTLPALLLALQQSNPESVQCLMSAGAAADAEAVGWLTRAIVRTRNNATEQARLHQMACILVAFGSDFGVPVKTQHRDARGEPVFRSAIAWLAEVPGFDDVVARSTGHPRPRPARLAG